MSERKFAGWGFLGAVMFGWLIELVYGFSAETLFRSGVRTFCILWFASGAAFYAGTIGGFLFGVPKAVSNPATTPSPSIASRYKINTNLEEISRLAYQDYSRSRSCAREQGHPPC